MDPKKSRTFLEPLCEHWEVKNPIEGVSKRVINAFEAKIKLRGEERSV
jgi:hypothetical protein